ITILTIISLVRYLGLKHNFKFLLGNIRILYGVCEILGVLVYPSKYKNIILILDKTLNTNIFELMLLFKNGWLDKTGNFIPGLGVRSNLLNLLCNYFSDKTADNFCINSSYLMVINSFCGEFGVHELFSTALMLKMQGLIKDITVKPFLGRGLLYYNSTVYELLPLAVCLNTNVFIKIGSLLAGGRYDNFLKISITKQASLGCSLGLTRIQDFYYCSRKHFVDSNRCICLCWPQYECFNSKLVLGILSIQKLGFKIKSIGSINFIDAIKRVNENCFLIYRWNNGWVFKDLLKRKHISSRINSFSIWRHLFIDQYWVSNIC
ncbi:hypothetical protein ACA081_00830, partial [Candidatus Hodgkinia cicadicola]